jgi:hypothetical protein
VALYFAHSGTSLDLYCVLSPGWLAARPNPFFVSAESSSFRINQQHPTYGLGKVRTTSGSENTTRRLFWAERSSLYRYYFSC